MLLSSKHIVWFNEVDKDDASLVGSKGAAMGEMIQNGFPMPPGFIITTTAYHAFIKENNLQTIISHLLEGIDYTNPKSTEKASQTIQKKIVNAKITHELASQIFTSCKKLERGIFKNPLVTLFPSTPIENLPYSQKEYQTVQGEANIIANIKELWASIFDTKAIVYNHEKNIDPTTIDIAVVVQRIVSAEKSGTIITIDPEGNDKKKIIIEALLGESEKGQKNEALDHYEVTKDSLSTIKKITAAQKTMYIKKGTKNKKVNIQAKNASLQKITNDEIRKLASLGKKLEKHTYFPQKITWAIEKGTTYIIQTRQFTPNTSGRKTQKTEVVQTVTKLYVTLDRPEAAENSATQQIDGVGLLKAEPMLEEIGLHPKKIIHEGKQKLYIKKLVVSLEQCCRPLSPRPVIYRASDLKTNEYRALIGGKAYEPLEVNPLLGYHGVYRYIHNPEVFTLELEAIKIVRGKKGFKNLWLMLPFVRTVEELKEIKQLIAKTGLYRSANFKVFMMVETPSNVIALDQYIEAGIDGVVINIDNLTTLLLGTDRNNSEVALEVNELDETVLWALEKTIKMAKKYDITSSICGQAVSRYPTLVEKLVSWGITSITVSPETLEKTHAIIAQTEQKLMASQ